MKRGSARPLQQAGRKIAFRRKKEVKTTLSLQAKSDMLKKTERRSILCLIFVEKHTLTPLQTASPENTAALIILFPLGH